MESKFKPGDNVIFISEGIMQVIKRVTYEEEIDEFLYEVEDEEGECCEDEFRLPTKEELILYGK